MSKLEWDKTGERRYEYGVDHGVLYTEQGPDFNPLSPDSSSSPAVELYYQETDIVEDKDPSTFSPTEDYDEDRIAFLKGLNLFNESVSFISGSINNETGQEEPSSVAKRSGVMTFPMGSYSLWPWCACGLPDDVYWYNDGTYIGHERLDLPENTSWFLIPQGANQVRFVSREAGKEFKSLFVGVEEYEGASQQSGHPDATIFEWQSLCTVHYPEEVITLSDENYTYGGVAWNGLTGVTESPDGAEANDLWADNIKYASIRSAETFGATIEAYQSPPEFGECDGTVSPISGVYLGQQKRKPFGFVYRTRKETEHGYKMHIIYNATASPSERAYETLNDSPDAITFSWELTTTPVSVEGRKPVSTIEIDPEKLLGYSPENPPEWHGPSDPANGDIYDPYYVLEAILFGTSLSKPFLPTPQFIMKLFTPRQVGMRKIQ